MSFSGHLSSVNSQNFVCSQSELLGKFFVMAVATAAASRSRKILIPKAYPLPKFKIGDLVAEDWVGDDDVAATDFGQVLGMRYLSEAQSCFPGNSWVYYINWTHSTTGLDFCYPNYDGEGSRESDLRLVS
jgi:hypothetical protein